MRVSEIIDLTILETGNYLVSTLVKSDIDLNKFKIFIYSVLAEYSNYRPLNKTIQIYIQDSPYTFIHENSPVIVNQLVPSLDSVYFDNKIVYVNDSVFVKNHMDPLPPWRYERPNLHTVFTGLMSVSGIFDYQVIPVFDDNKNIIDYDLPEIFYNNTEFLSLVKAKFLISVGKQRRAFTTNDLPIATDASELVSEGNEILNTTLERLQANSKWWLII